MADVLDIITLAEGRTSVAIGPTDTSHDVELAGFITAVSRLIDDEFGPVVVRTITADQLDIIDETHARTTFYPVVSYTSVTEYVYGVGTVLTQDTGIAPLPSRGYFAESYSRDAALLSGRIVRRSGGYQYPFTPGTLQVLATYVAGRFATTAACDARWKLAATLTLQNQWRARQESTNQVNQFDVPSANFPTFAVPKAVMDLLRHERQTLLGSA